MGKGQELKYDPNRIQYWGDTANYILAQTENSLDVVSQLLQSNPPNVNLGVDRKAAFVMLDNIMHLTGAAHIISLQNYYHRRMAGTLALLKANKGAAGVFVYKVYNHGFIVQTATATFAFDLIRGYSSGVDEFAIPDSLATEFINRIDVFFVSHKHPDHADEWVARTALDRGKIVITPDSVWMDKPFYSKVIHPVRSLDSIYRLRTKSNGIIKYSALPGHQGDLLNNVYVVTTPDGLTFAHTGDQYNLSDFAWIDSVKKHFSIDILLPNSWSLDVERLFAGFDPKTVIPSHENELGHTIDHREAYWLSMNKFNKLNKKVLYMTWGEVLGQAIFVQPGDCADRCE